MSFSGQSPSAKRLRLQPQAADPVNPAEGDLFYSDGTSRREGIWYYKNGQWTQDSLQDEGNFTLNIFATNNNPTLVLNGSSTNYFLVQNNIMSIWSNVLFADGSSSGLGTYVIQLPSGWDIDTAKISLLNNFARVGYGTVRGLALDSYFAVLFDNGSIKGITLKSVKSSASLTDDNWSSSPALNAPISSGVQLGLVVQLPVIRI
jgi:hypothetical protein